MMVARSDWRGTKSNTLRAADGSATKKAGSRGAALSPHAVSFARFAAQLARGSGVLKSLGTGAGFIFILDHAIPRQAGSLGHCTVDPPSCCAASPLPPLPTVVEPRVALPVDGVDQFDNIADEGRLSTVR
jgi:hypothetical protein